MNDLYDVILHLIEVLLPNNAEKHSLTEHVKKLQAEEQAKVTPKKAERDGSNKQ